MKKKNLLSVWTLACRPSYYLTHPHKFIHEVYWNFRNWIHRANYGYAYVDYYDFCEWYPRVGAAALRHLAKNTHGYPGIKPWATMKEWRAYLEHMANRLDRCANSMDILFGEERNEYKDELDEIIKRREKRTEHEDGSVTVSHTLTPEEDEIRKKYWEREEEIRNADNEYNKQTYKWLAEDLPHFWD